MKIKTLEVAGLYSAIKSMRLPYGKEYFSEMYIKGSAGSVNCVQDFALTFLDPRDKNLAQRLIQNGDEHAKPMRGVLAYLDITAPIDWWVEAETYEAGHQRLFSASTMNTEGKQLKGHALRDALDKISFGREIRKIDYFSYQTLRRIVRQRYNHRKAEWHFCIEHIKTLPFAYDFIFIGLENEMKIHDEWMDDYFTGKI